MKQMRDALVCVLVFTLILLTGWAIRIERDADTVVRSFPGELQSTRAAVAQQITDTRKDVLDASERQLAATRCGLLRHITAFRTTVGASAATA